MNEGFKYTVPAPTKDGTYTLVLKFSEVYFNEPGQKVFDIKLGSKTIIKDLDIFGTVYSRGVPYDTFTEFSMKNGDVYFEVTHIPLTLPLG